MSELNDIDFQELKSKFGKVLEALHSFADVLKSIREWYTRNADTIATYLIAFNDFGTCMEAVDRMKERQIVFTDNITIEFATEINNSENVDTTIQKYYFENKAQNMNTLIARCSLSHYVTDHGNLFSEIDAAYKMGHYQLACIGMCSLIDGILADATFRQTDTNFKKRIKEITKKMNEEVPLSDIDMQLLCVGLSVDSFEDSIFAHSDFSQPEPDFLNRHWLLHGRTRRTYTQYDFLKALLWLDAIIILANANEQFETEETE